MKKTCNTCEWFVEEVNGHMGHYSHAEAKKLRHGFCLKKKLFAETEPNDRACRRYQEEENELPGKN